MSPGAADLQPVDWGPAAVTGPTLPGNRSCHQEEATPLLLKFVPETRGQGQHKVSGTPPPAGCQPSPVCPPKLAKRKKRLNKYVIPDSSQQAGSWKQAYFLNCIG